MSKGKIGLILVLVVGVTSGLLLGKYYGIAQGRAGEHKHQQQALQKQLSEFKNPAARIFTTVVKLVSPSVVNISTKKYIRYTYEDPLFSWFFSPRTERREQIGSGVIIDKEGYILTNNHVVGGADEIKVTMADKREFIGKVVGTDELSDLAVVKIKVKDLVPALIGDSDKIEVGEWVLAIGNPFGLEHTVTSGIISAQRGSEASPGSGFIQTDAPINPGNSGGPLVNLQGEVIGINSYIISKTGGYQGIGFAIPINRAKEIMKKLIEKGKVIRPYLGIRPADIDRSLAYYYDLPDLPALLRLLKMKESQGVFVLEVLPGSPSEKAGLLEGDVIIEIDQHAIKNSNDLTKTIAGLAIDSRVAIKIIRNGKAETLTALIGP